MPVKAAPAPREPDCYTIRKKMTLTTAKAVADTITRISGAS
jgi:hypothetical protein